ncbi:hypothetical protein KR018_003139 [Drosophila ironensis]|nr:hypothetical protein KR018_003139 [Drosophila ironensis]
MPFVGRLQQLCSFLVHVCLPEAVQLVQDLQHALLRDLRGLLHLE